MAVTKMSKIRSTLSLAIKYILNEAKTENGELVTCYECSPMMADKEFEAVSKLYSNEGISRRMDEKEGRSIKAWHLMQSFSPDDKVSPEKAHKIGWQYAMEYTRGEHQFIVATHVDRGHIHNHIMFNSTSFKTNKKFNYRQNEMHRRVMISDKLCRENGLSVIEEPSGIRSRKRTEYYESKSGKSWKDRLREAIDRSILLSKDYDEFLLRMELEEHYKIKLGRYISFKYETEDDSQERYTRSKRLGERYSTAAILYRLDHKENEKGDNSAHIIWTPSGRQRARQNLIIPIENRIIYLRSKGTLSEDYENRLIKEETEILLSSFNYLMSKGLIYDTDVKDKYEELDNKAKDLYEKTQNIDEELSKLTTELRYLRNYKERGDGSDSKDRVMYEAALKYFRIKKKDPDSVDKETLKERIDILKEEYKETKEHLEKLKEEKSRLYYVSQNLGKTIGIEPIRSYKEQREEKERVAKAPRSKEEQKKD